MSASDTALRTKVLLEIQMINDYQFFPNPQTSLGKGSKKVVSGGFKWFGQCPKENVFFHWGLPLVDACICLMMALLQIDNSVGSALQVFDDSLNTTLWDFFLFTVLLIAVKLAFTICRNIDVVNSTQAISPWTRCDFCNVFKRSYIHCILNWCNRISY